MVVLLKKTSSRPEIFPGPSLHAFNRESPSATLNEKLVDWKSGPNEIVAFCAHWNARRQAQAGFRDRHVVREVREIEKYPMIDSRVE